MKYPVKIRLSGTVEDIELVSKILQLDFEIIEKSKYYDNRGSDIIKRLYLEVQIKDGIREDAEWEEKENG